MMMIGHKQLVVIEIYNLIIGDEMKEKKLLIQRLFEYHPMKNLEETHFSIAQRTMKIPVNEGSNDERVNEGLVDVSVDGFEYSSEFVSFFPDCENC